MAKALQRRRGTHEEHKSFTGLEGEFTYDTTEKRIVAHDGVTKGGIPLAKKTELESAKTELEGKIEQVSSSLDPRILDAASQSDILEAVSQATVGNVDTPTLEGLQAQVAANASNIASIPVPVRYVTETWSSGTEWYTKYNDGWIEQGGTVRYSSGWAVQTFQAPFSNNQYTITASTQGSTIDYSGNSFQTPFTLVKTANGVSFKFAIYGGDAGCTLGWYACGY